jgi:RNA polymerase sigma-70 factor (ECF subfamily)
MAVLLRLLRRRELAEEALHDVFVRVWLRAASFDPARGPAMGWLVAIARNIAFDHHRRHRRELASLGDPIEELPDPRSDAGTALDRRALIDCLDRLEPEPRRCVLLAYQGGYSYDELSTMLGRPSGTIKSWVHRSLQRLRACLEAE